MKIDNSLRAVNVPPTDVVSSRKFSFAFSARYDAPLWAALWCIAATISAAWRHPGQKTLLRPRNTLEFKIETTRSYSISRKSSR